MEQEFFNFMLLEKEHDVAEFLEAYSSNDTKRKMMIENLLSNNIKNINNFFSEEDKNLPPTNSSETIKALFAGLGINLTKEGDE